MKAALAASALNLIPVLEEAVVMDKAVGQLRVRQCGAVTVVCFDKLAEAVYRERAVVAIGEELSRLIAAGPPPHIVLNFEGKPFVPAAVFEGKLVLLMRRVEAAGGVLKMCGVPAPVLEHFRLNRLADLFDIYENEAQALGTVGSR